MYPFIEQDAAYGLGSDHIGGGKFKAAFGKQEPQPQVGQVLR